ncbi:G2/mitotic-specific cyclin-B [Pseudoscourfieldia marina]
MPTLRSASARGTGVGADAGLRAAPLDVYDEGLENNAAMPRSHSMQHAKRLGDDSTKDGKKRSRESQPLQTITNGNVPLPAPTTRLRSASSSAQIAAARSAANATMQAHRRSATTRTASTAAAHTPPPESLAFPFYVHDPLVPVDYMDEIDRTCHSKQLIHAPNRNYMTSQRDINPHMRGILVDWLVEVGEEYRFDGETLFLAVNYVDRCLSRLQMQRSKLQLLGVTCMLIASKYEEIYPPPVKEFRYITDNTYSRDEIVGMEREILKTLKFELTVPTAKWFLRRYLRSLLLLSGDSELAAAASSPLLNHPASSLPPSPLPEVSPPRSANQQSTASPTADKFAARNPDNSVAGPGAFAPHVRLTYLSYYLLELTLLDFNFLKFKTSEVAASALMIALYTLHVDAHGERAVSAPMLAVSRGVTVPPPGSVNPPMPAAPAAVGRRAARSSTPGAVRPTLVSASSFPPNTAMPRHQHQDTPWSPTLQQHTGYAPGNLRECATALHAAYLDHARAHAIPDAQGAAEGTARKLPAIFEKYKDAKLSCASRILPPAHLADYLFSPLSEWPAEMQERWNAWAQT